MAIAHEFDYFKPGTLREAVRTLMRYGTRGQVLAGGTDLISLIAENMVAPGAVIDIKGIPNLNKIEFKNGVLSIGALATFSDLRDSPILAKKFPVVREMTGWWRRSASGTGPRWSAISARRCRAATAGRFFKFTARPCSLPGRTDDGRCR